MEVMDGNIFLLSLELFLVTVVHNIQQRKKKITYFCQEPATSVPDLGVIAGFSSRTCDYISK